jgi:hypothetical protein
VIALENLQQFTAINLLVDPGAIGGPKVIPSCAEISLIWALGDAKLAFNVLCGRYSGAFSGSQAQANAIATALSSGTQWTAMAAFLAPTVSFVGVRIRDISAANFPFIPSAITAVPGTSAGTELPDETAICLTLRTAFTGPQNRGRLYVPGFATTALATGNVVAAACVTAVQNWGTIIAGVLATNGYTWCVGHQARAAYTGRTGTAHPARAAGSVPITTVSVRDNHWDSQRRRGLK